MCVWYMDIISIKVSQKNNDVARMVQKIKNDNGGCYSDEVCRLLRDAYTMQQYSSIPRMDLFCDKGIRGKSVAESFYEGRVSEEEIVKCFLSCKSFLEEMYSSPSLIRIVDKHCEHIDLSRLMRGMDKWQLQH